MNFIIMVLIIMVNNFKWGCLVLGIFQIYQLDNTFLCLLHTNKLPDICIARSRLRKSPRRVLQTNKHIRGDGLNSDGEQFGDRCWFLCFIYHVWQNKCIDIIRHVSMHYCAKFQLLIQLVKGIEKHLSPICSPLLFGASPRRDCYVCAKCYM